MQQRWEQGLRVDSIALLARFDNDTAELVHLTHVSMHIVGPIKLSAVLCRSATLETYTYLKP